MAKDDRPKPIADGGEESPEVYGIVKEGKGYKLTRRGVLGVLGASAAAAAATAATGCAHATKMRRIRQMGLKSWTQPCGTPIPPNAVCVCNCIATNATFRSTGEQICVCDTIEVPVTQSVPGAVCACDTVCTCNTIGGDWGGGGGGGGGGG